MWCYRDLGIYTFCQRLWNLKFFRNSSEFLWGGMNKRETAHTITFTEVYVRIIIFFKSAFWFFSTNLGGGVGVFPVIFCLGCYALFQLWSRVQVSRRFCHLWWSSLQFHVQSQLAYSGSKVQLNSGKLTDLIRKFWITLLSLQPIQLMQISEHAEANLPVFSGTAGLCLTTTSPSCLSWLVGYIFPSCVHFLPVTQRNKGYCTFRFFLNMHLGCGWNAQCEKERVFQSISCLLSFFVQFCVLAFRKPSNIQQPQRIHLKLSIYWSKILYQNS